MKTALRAALLDFNTFADSETRGTARHAGHSADAGVTGLLDDDVCGGWRAVVATFVARRTGAQPDSLMPQTVAWLMLGVALSAYEYWLAHDEVSLRGPSARRSTRSRVVWITHRGFRARRRWGARGDLGAGLHPAARHPAADHRNQHPVAFVVGQNFRPSSLRGAPRRWPPVPRHWILTSYWSLQKYGTVTSDGGCVPSIAETSWAWSATLLQCSTRT